MAKGTIQTTTLAIVVLVVALVGAAYMLLSEEENTSNPPPNFPQQTPSGYTGGVAPPVPAPAAIAKNTYHSGTATLKPTNAMSGNGISSSMLYLHKSEARDANGNQIWDTSGKQLSNAAFDEQKTRYSIMKKIAVSGTTSSGSDGLKYISGEAINAVSSGAWAQTVTANENDMFLAYTYVASGNSYSAPVHGINISTVKLIQLTEWNEPNTLWSGMKQWNGASPDWSIKIYPNITFTDDSGVRRDNYTVGDSATVKTKQTWNFYINGTNAGEDISTADVGIFLTGPKNLTTKFNSLTLTPSGGGGSLKVTSLSTVYSDDQGSVEQAASLLTGNVTTFNDQLYYIGSVPKSWFTERTSSDRNQIAGTMTSETYSTDVRTTIWLVQNAHAKSTSNGAFVNAKWFDLHFSNGGTSGYDVAP